MKYALALLTVISAFSALPARADNPDVEAALKRRPDLSSFYAALINTGVNHELSPHTTYTIFAPTNEAFARIPQAQYPCFYSEDCRAQVADIVRNHILRGSMNIADLVRRQGGVYTLGGHFVRIGEPYRNAYSIDGNDIVYQSWYGDGVLYKINGVIASHEQMASVQYPVDTPHEQVVDRPGTPDCNLPGCPAGKTHIVNQTILLPPVVEPAR